MLNIVIPMAGAGSRFAVAGYALPKPLIPIHGSPMIQWVIRNLRSNRPHRFIFICQQSHVQAYGLAESLAVWAPGSQLIELSSVTDGPACTVLSAKFLIDNDDQLMIANSDQYIDADIDAYLDAIPTHNLDGLIMTMKATDPKWSFVGLSETGEVTRCVEKEVISEEATVGVYNFKRGRDFVRAAESMIAQNKCVKGEFYVCPAYNELIHEGQRIGIHNIGRVGAGMHGLGTPEDLEAFLQLELSHRLAYS